MISIHELQYVDPHRYDEFMEEAYQYEQDLLNEQESNDCE